MKKSLLALAALSAFATAAQAQSSVTVYGIVDAGITETTTDVTTVSNGAVVSKTDKTTGNGSAYTSQRLGFRGTEDLGGGLKAGFVYEFGFNDSDGPNPQNAENGTDTASPNTTRVATVGLSGAFGTLDLGRQTVIADKAWGVGDVGGANNFIGRAYTSSTKLNNSRSDRLINYVSPKFSGFTIHAAYGERDNENSTYTGSTTTTTFDQADSVKETGLGLEYSAGALNAMIGYSKEEHRLNGARLRGNSAEITATSSALAVAASQNKLGSDPEQLVIGANYDFKMAKVFVTYAKAEDTNESGAKINDKKVMELGVSIPFGKTTLNLSAFDGENKASTAAADLTDISGYQVGVLHAFSKRTTGYVVYGASESKVPATKTETEQFGFGVRHAF